MKAMKKPVVIEVHQFAGGSIESGIPEAWIKDGNFNFSEDGEFIIIPTLEGTHKGMKGDYIIKGVRGEFYPCRKDIFEETYEVVDNGAR